LILPAAENHGFAVSPSGAAKLLFSATRV
jgi:hypothetical protein